MKIIVTALSTKKFLHGFEKVKGLFQPKIFSWIKLAKANNYNKLFIFDTV